MLHLRQDCTHIPGPCLWAALLLTLVGAVPVEAAIITIEQADIYTLPDNAVGSGSGTLDLITHSFAGNQIPNGTFDNGNADLPQGGGADVEAFSESYLTSFGDLQQFYLLNFPTPPDEMVLFLDLNETGATAQATNWVNRMQIWLNPTTVGNLDPVANDLTSEQQNGINETFSGGTLLSELQNPVNLSVSNQGNGAADFIIFSGINPFAYNPTDTILIFIEMNTLNNGAETFFLSGEFGAEELRDVVGRPQPQPLPEPGTIALLGLGLGLIGLRRRRRS